MPCALKQQGHIQSNQMLHGTCSTPPAGMCLPGRVDARNQCFLDSIMLLQSMADHEYLHAMQLYRGQWVRMSIVRHLLASMKIPGPLVDEVIRVAVNVESGGYLVCRRVHVTCVLH